MAPVPSIDADVSKVLICSCGLQAGSGAWLMAGGGEKWVVGREKVGFASLLPGLAIL
jgi:hypothetical protein